MAKHEVQLAATDIVHPQANDNLSEEQRLIQTRRASITDFLEAEMDIEHARNIIQSKIPGENGQSNVRHCIGFFSTTLPDVAQQLLNCVEKQDIDGYIQLAYDKIPDAIHVRLLKTYHINGTIATPGTKQIAEMIQNIQDKKTMMDTIKSQPGGTYTRGSGPTVALGLLPQGRW